MGDYVLAINGEELKANDDPYRLLKNRADNPVQLTVNNKPSFDGARTISYRPITDEGNLIYLDWVNGNRRKVAEMTGGRVGYIHVPDMGANGIREFIKWYYGQINKEGLVVDVRANGGGNVSRMLIERLRRKTLALGYARTNDEATTYPDAVFRGPMAALLNENSSSDGDIFPAMFREAGLGPLIGKRSWGGVVGITNRGPLDQWRERFRARIRVRKHQRRMGHRRLWRRPRHRSRERSEVGDSKGATHSLSAR